MNIICTTLFLISKMNEYYNIPNIILSVLIVYANFLPVNTLFTFTSFLQLINS